MTIHTVTVLGLGVLGSQIAFQAALHGFQVTGYDLSDDALAGARATLDRLAPRIQVDLGLGDDAMAQARARLGLTTDLAQAVGGADLVIELVPEDPAIKRDLYARIAPLAPEGAIFATNSSTLLPSALADATGRPARFLALHFANEIWAHNIAEIMGHPGTDPAVYDRVVAFARAIGMVPIQIAKEQPGYVLNSLLVPFLTAAAGLLVKGIATPQDIDKTWKISTGSPRGPFEIYDIVGLNTAYAITARGGETSRAFADLIKRDYIDKGKLGVATGEGFYRWPREG